MARVERPRRTSRLECKVLFHSGFEHVVRFWRLMTNDGDDEMQRLAYRGHQMGSAVLSVSFVCCFHGVVNFV